jgi:8-oxo-dGTP diphosphatase
VSAADATAVTDVAVGVVRRADGRVLLAERPAGKPWAGYWEFPGGKIEAGENSLAALTRELHEELGIELDRGFPWITLNYAYPEKRVRLHFHRVLAWHGTPHGREDQRLSWEDPRAIAVQPLLPANADVLRALNLPPVYAITNAGKLGVEVFLERLRTALAHDVRLIQVREPQMSRDQLCVLAAKVVTLAHAAQARVLINGEAANRPSLACGPRLDPIGDALALAREVGADGVHLQASQLMKLVAPPEGGFWSASCHNAAELARAAELGASFVVLSPVLPTPTHPEAAGMGWARFAELIRDYPLPVYALGGMKTELIETAMQHGAHGISLLSGAW